MHLHVSLSVFGSECHALSREMCLDHDGPTAMRDSRLLAEEFDRLSKLLYEHIRTYEAVAQARVNATAERAEQKRIAVGRLTA
jgi:predicted short-subunit dehydrogenase-like oxidoreductase (DUF2520 family)